MTLSQHLRSVSACSNARSWAKGKVAQEAWEQCDRGDWLLWWAARTPENTKQEIVLVACACARLALKHVPPGEERPRLAIEAAERWAANPTPDNLDGVRKAR